MARDNFSQLTKDLLARRVGFRCSNPSCRALTRGPHSEPSHVLNLGVAAHITAAPGGPSYTPSLSERQRANSDNGIWLCQTRAKLIDNDSGRYTASVLMEWKVAAEEQTTRELSAIPDSEFFPQAASATHIPIPRIANLLYDEARARLIRAGWQPMLNHWTHVDNVSRPAL